MVQTPAGGTLGAWGGQIAPRVPPNPLPETPRVLGEGLGVPRACRVPATSFPGPASPFLHPPFLPPWIPSFPLEASAGRRRNPGRKAAGAPWLTAPGDSSQPKFPALPLPGTCNIPKTFCKIPILHPSSLHLAFCSEEATSALCSQRGTFGCHHQRWTHPVPASSSTKPPSPTARLV